MCPRTVLIHCTYESTCELKRVTAAFKVCVLLAALPTLAWCESMRGKFSTSYENCESIDYILMKFFNRKSKTCE